MQLLFFLMKISLYYSVERLNDQTTETEVYNNPGLE